MPPPKKSSAGQKNAAPPPPPAAAPAPAPAPSKSSKGKGSGTDSGRKPGGKQQQQDAGSTAPAKPTERQIIGGPSYTGKLPTELLSNYCRQNGWDNEQDFKTFRFPDGFLGSVTLRCENPKTKLMEEVKFTPPREMKKATGETVKLHQDTHLEAKHLLATYALNRVANMTNIDFVLPITYKGFWEIFESNRKHDLKGGKGWMYEADPFRAQRERKALMEKLEKDRLARVAAAEAAASGSMGVRGGRGDWNERMKGWQDAPIAEMGKDMRMQVEDLVRKYHDWNPNGVDMSKEARGKVVEELTKLGFRKSHVEEACDWAADREECLDWLLVHVPEDDLPPRFLPDKYTVGVSITAGNVPLAQEYTAKRLSAAGYSLELSHATLQQHKGNEALAAEQLQHFLIDRPFSSEPDLLEFHNGDPWEEEQNMNEAIWPPPDFQKEPNAPKPKFSRLSPTVSRLLIEPDSPPPAYLKPFVPEKIWLHVQKPVANYPSSAILVITIHTEGRIGLPAHIRLSIIRQAAAYAYKVLLGAPMTFSIMDWLNANILRMIEHPGRLRDVAAAITQLEKKSATEDAPHKSEKRIKVKPYPINWTAGSPASAALYRAWQDRLSQPAMKRMMWTRQNLPAWKMREKIVSAVTKSQVTIITGETGSGKSTQSVQFILDDLIERKLGEQCNIVCTQPRRISALSLADRVAEERCSNVGQEVGYVIRGDSKSKRGVTKITFVTTGVLLRRMQMAGGGEEGTEDEGVWGGLDGVSHVVVDEVHERSLDTDFLLVLLKRALTAREDLKVVLMSATVDADTFADYFKKDGMTVAMVEIEGRTFSVQDFYLEDVVKKTEFELFTGPSKGPTESGLTVDPYVGATIRAIGDRINYALIAQTVRYIDAQLGKKEGGILIFLPGTMEIRRTLEAIQRLPLGNQRFHALPLHAALTPRDQQAVFPPAPQGKRKVVCATNVAETSITILDIVAVIDTGRVKETSYAPESDMVRLLETWASKAACKQRKGRAGRVRAGSCYKLYTRAIEGQKMPERLEPEIRRVPLQQACLVVKAMGVKDVRAFLASAITPPDIGAVESAMTVLEKVGALREEELTALGRHMSMIPADLKCSKLLVYGCIFGCLDMTLTIASILSTKSPFISPMDKRNEAKGARVRFGGVQGDLLADALAYLNWAHLRLTSSTTNVKFWCDQNFLSHHALLDIASNRSQLLSSLKECGLVPIDYELPAPTSPPAALLSLPQHSQEQQLISILPNSAAPDPLVEQNHNLCLLRALIGAAFTPHLARIQMPHKKYKEVASGTVEVDPEARMIKYYTGQGGGRVFVHPGSTLFDAQGFVRGAAFMAFFVKMEGEKVTIREITPVGTYPLLLLGGELRVDTLGRGMTVDGWMRVRGWGRIGVLVGMVRRLVEGVLKDRFVVTRAVGEEEQSRREKEMEVVGVVRRMIDGEGHLQMRG
ncbi:P-loop containing nucleoside triphosphate hydrolase protein [Terfezia boudieri ATCC MYA-4762]|uniref:P-loop containing nucleoside triphosphate hydrolase protein n=1 Tax=Terfezia boudieri ATCC MYA-4762 TaxID=1051890 RepID=A0A3N4MR60_9PEZI|nr:P-loop containing nucleoside triphosphate hydrolase protein [Terfezia boudieri ATCC MYA-4762]